MSESYVTRAGTRFYGRKRELARLDSLAKSRRLVTIYGPRGAGKGELARFWARAAGWARVAVVDAHEGRVEGDPALAGALEARLGDTPTPLDLLDEALGSAGGSRVVVVIDGLEFLERYRGLPLEASLGSAASDLQAAATAMSRGGRWRGATLVATSHSGFMGSLYLRGRLACTTSGHILLLGLDEDSFRAFYEDYAGAAGCRLGVDEALRLTGGLPGLLVDLCTRGAGVLREWVEDWLAFLESALTSARLDVSRGLNWDVKPGELIRLAASLHGLRARPLEAPHHYLLAESLAAHGVAYTRPAAGGVEVAIPIPIVREALTMAAEEGLSSALDLDPDRLLARLLEGGTGPQ